MTTIYFVPDEHHQSRKLIGDMMSKYHQSLNDAGVRIGVLFAANPEGPAVKHGGYPAHATIKVMSLKDRVTKGYDAELMVSEESWDGFDEDQRAALVDHELTHLEIVAKKGIVQRDDIDRPKLKTRKGDWNCGDGFAEVVARHGRASIEFENARTAIRHAEESLPKVGEGEPE